MPAISHAFEPSNIPQSLLPNIHGKSLTTPIAWGASNGVVFAGVGGTVNAPYSDKADGAAVLGVGVGDPIKNLGAQIAFVSLDLDEWKEYSMTLHLYHDFGGGTAVGAGIENVMLTDGGDAGKSYYIVFSHGVQGDMFASETGTSKLHFSIGAGTERFGEKSERDVLEGKGRYGTYVFANVAYELFNEFNVVADWNGINLNAGLSKTFWLDKYPVAVTVGAADLTDNSGDDVRLVFAVGTGFKI